MGGNCNRFGLAGTEKDDGVLSLISGIDLQVAIGLNIEADIGEEGSRRNIKFENSYNAGVPIDL